MAPLPTAVITGIENVRLMSSSFAITSVQLKAELGSKIPAATAPEAWRKWFRDSNDENVRDEYLLININEAS